MFAVTLGIIKTVTAQSGDLFNYSLPESHHHHQRIWCYVKQLIIVTQIYLLFVFVFPDVWISLYFVKNIFRIKDGMLRRSAEHYELRALDNSASWEMNFKSVPKLPLILIAISIIRCFQSKYVYQDCTQQFKNRLLHIESQKV